MNSSILLVRPLFYIILILNLFILGCDSEAPKTIIFKHDITDGQKPWTREEFEIGEKDFTFGIISDLTEGERNGIFNVAVQ